MEMEIDTQAGQRENVEPIEVDVETDEQDEQTEASAFPSAEERFTEELTEAEKAFIDATMRQTEIEAELREAKQETKEAYKRVVHLRARGPKEMPLFDKPGDSNETIEKDESWRQTTTEELGLSASICEILRENDPPIETLGGIADWTIEYSLTDIPRIGGAKAEAIEEATDKYWASRFSG